MAGFVCGALYADRSFDVVGMNGIGSFPIFSAHRKSCRNTPWSGGCNSFDFASWRRDGYGHGDTVERPIGNQVLSAAAPRSPPQVPWFAPRRADRVLGQGASARSVATPPANRSLPGWPRHSRRRPSVRRGNSARRDPTTSDPISPSRPRGTAKPRDRCRRP